MGVGPNGGVVGKKLPGGGISSSGGVDGAGISPRPGPSTWASGPHQPRSAERQSGDLWFFMAHALPLAFSLPLHTCRRPLGQG
jgi:hypothetical protein